MFTIDNFDYDCTKKCKFRDHGQRITAALTKKDITDEEIAAYTAKVCKNFTENVDNEGRTPLHVAASVGRYRIVEWLLNCGANVDNKDEESGSSALHRALFYGCVDCAVLLNRYGASFELTDNDFRNPLQHICKPSELKNRCVDVPLQDEVLVWGSNKNYNLGLGNDQEAPHPLPIDVFRKQGISIQSLSISVYHSLFIDSNGLVYTVGHGKGGRLGTKSELSLQIPKRLILPTKDPEEKAICVSASRNHSLILTNKGTIFACGMNLEKQLGIQPTPEKMIMLKKVASLPHHGEEEIVGVIAKDFHSVAFSRKDIWIWGKNNGQFGINLETTHLILPKKLSIPHDKTIKAVETNSWAVACYTTCKLLLIYSSCKMKMLKTPSSEPLVCMSLSGGTDKKDVKSEAETLKVLVLTVSQCLYIWHESSAQYIRCVYLQTRELDVDKIILNNNRLLILSKGDVYTGRATVQTIQNSIDISQYTDTYNKKEICKSSRIKIDLKRVIYVDRATDIFADDDFESFAVLQETSGKYFKLQKQMQQDNTYEKLLNEVNEFDAVHDVAFHVGGEVFFAHKFIVFSRAKGIMNAVGDNDKDVYLNDAFLTAKMFEIILKYLYSNYYPVCEDMDDVHQSLGADIRGDRNEAINLFLKFAERFELLDLVRGTKSMIAGILFSKPKYPKFKRTWFQNLHDLTIICADNKEINAHKCILVARLEYFQMMFSNSWAETKTANLKNIPYEYMLPLVDFVYTNDVEAFRKEKYSESFLYNMIVICDQLFAIRLQIVCEQLISERISTKKCGEMLEFACAYNCVVLEKDCLEFICQNLARVMEQKSLEVCKQNVLSKINVYYRQMYQHKFDFRIITPSQAVSDDELKRFVSNFSVNLDSVTNEIEIDTKIKSKVKPKLTKTAASKRNYEIEAIQKMKDINTDVPLNGKRNVLLESGEDKNELEKQLHGEARTWTKVIESKKSNKSKWALSALKSNEALKKETSSNRFEDQQEVNTVEQKTVNSANEQVSPGFKSTLCFGNITPLKSEKLSQKERKRLSSESKTEKHDSPMKPPAVVVQKSNPWQDVQQSSFSDIMKMGSGSPPKLVSFPVKLPTPLESTKTPKDVNNTITYAQFDASSKSLSKILVEERKQKDYFEKVKTKSLFLTQIEETAIDELKHFYNTEDVFDELIGVDRKHYAQTINFAVWQHF